MLCCMHLLADVARNVQQQVPRGFEGTGLAFVVFSAMWRSPRRRKVVQCSTCSARVEVTGREDPPVRQCVVCCKLWNASPAVQTPVKKRKHLEQYSPEKEEVEDAAVGIEQEKEQCTDTEPEDSSSESEEAEAEDLQIQKVLSMKQEEFTVKAQMDLYKLGPFRNMKQWLHVQGFCQNAEKEGVEVMAERADLAGGHCQTMGETKDM